MEGSQRMAGYRASCSGRHLPLAILVTIVISANPYVAQVALRVLRKEG
jgi:hypothetical protein